MRPGRSIGETAIRIAGGGLAGLTAAIGLARAGLRVDVFERHADTGLGHAPRCDALENWTTAADLLAVLPGWGIDPSVLRRPQRILVHAHDGECHALAQARRPFYLVRRGSEPGTLDQSLKREALACGVRIRYGQTMPPEAADIRATGARGPGFFLDAGISFRTTLEDQALILVDSRVAPKAYAYLVVLDGRATLAVLLTRQFRDARRLLERAVVAFRRLQPFPIDEVRRSAGVGGAPAAFLAPPDGTIIAGEAAGFQDYLWGFGIRHALHSGALAARARADSTEYWQLADAQIRPLVQTSLINRRLFDWGNNTAYRSLIRHLADREDLDGRLRRAYGSHTLRRAFWPWIERRMLDAHAGGIA